MSISPRNNWLAAWTYDSRHVAIYAYSAGNGTASGGSLAVAGSRSIPNAGFVSNSTVWLDDDSALVLGNYGGTSPGGALESSPNVPALYRIDVDSASNPIVSQPVLVASAVVGEMDYTFSGLAYEPSISPYLYVSASALGASSVINRLAVLDPRNDFQRVVPVLEYGDPTNGMNTMRELALDANGNLLVSVFAGSGANPSSDIIEVLPNAADPTSLVSNSGTTGLHKRGSASTPFSGIDVALGVVDWNSGATVDIGADDVVQRHFYSPDASPLSRIRAKLAVGYNSGAWGGVAGGIGSSLAGATRYVGYTIDESFGGTIQFALTLPGDANLDRTVNFDDLLMLAASYNSLMNERWGSGDFNYDGAVNFDDLLLLAMNYNQTMAPPSARTAERGASIPEPAGLAFFGTGCAVFVRSKRLPRRRDFTLLRC